MKVYRSQFGDRVWLVIADSEGEASRKLADYVGQKFWEVMLDMSPQAKKLKDKQRIKRTRS